MAVPVYIKPPLMTARQFALKVGVSPVTLKRYEEKGYITPHAKTPDGRSIYHEDQVAGFGKTVADAALQKTDPSQG